MDLVVVPKLLIFFYIFWCFVFHSMFFFLPVNILYNFPTYYVLSIVFCLFEIEWKVCESTAFGLFTDILKCLDLFCILVGIQ